MSISSRPNPFNPRTVITYVLPVDGRARLVVYDVAGRVVRRLLNRWEAAGPHEVLWDGRNDQGLHAPSGAYLSRLTIGEHEIAHRMLLLE
jgi:flagellar hook assembly protein FlgD